MYWGETALTCGAQCFSNPENFLGSLPALATTLLIRSYTGLNAAGGSGAPGPSRICGDRLNLNAPRAGWAAFL